MRMRFSSAIFLSASLGESASSGEATLLSLSFYLGVGVLLPFYLFIN